MNSHDRLENIRLRMLRGGASATYVNRLVGELSEHFQESFRSALARGATDMEAEADALASLGEEREIVSVALRTLRRDAWFGRHRLAFIVLFGVMIYPVMASLIAMLWVWIGSRFVAMGVPKFGTASQVWQYLLEVSCNFVLPAIWFLWMKRYCERHSFGRGFTWAACAVMVFWALQGTTAARPIAHDHWQVEVIVGLGWPPVMGTARVAFAAVFACAVLASRMFQTKRHEIVAAI